MPFRRLFLPIAALTCFALPALAEEVSDSAVGDNQGSSFVIERVTFDDPPSSGGNAVSGLVASLDRARRNGVKGGSARPRTISLEQALRMVEWRQGVAQQLERVLP